MPDVLIAGGGIAGSALAIMLGRSGLAVELFERGHFPREKPCGEGLMPPGVAVLERWGLADEVGGAPFYGVRYRFGDRMVAGRFPKLDGAPAVGRGQRRRVLDEVLFRVAAATPGVTAHVDTPVEGAIVENGRVVGLKVGGLKAGLEAGGESRRAALTVAADGVHSRLRHQLGLDVAPRRKRLGLRAHFRLAPGQEQPPWVEIFVQAGRELYVTPLPNQEVQVAALAEAGSLDGPPEPTFRRWWSGEPGLAARLEGAEPVSALAGMSPLAGGARVGVFPGLVLLGDAAGFVDPITGGGMAQALLSADLLAGYLAPGVQMAGTGLSARVLQQPDGWLWQFEHERRAMLRNYRLMTKAILWLSARPRIGRSLLAVVGRSPALFSHLLGVSAGMRPFFGKSFGKRMPAPSLGSATDPKKSDQSSATGDSFYRSFGR